MKSLGRRLFGFSLLPGGHGGGVTPVSIPNTEVKYTSGEGTAGVARGRVARRQAFFSGGSHEWNVHAGLFFVYDAKTEQRFLRRGKEYGALGHLAD